MITAPAPRPSKPASAADDFFVRLIAWCTAAGFAGMLASLTCLSRGANGRLAIGWSWWSLPWAAVGFAAGLWFWRLLWQAEAELNPLHPARRALIRYSFVLGAAAFTSFVYPIRFVDPVRRTEVLVGLAMAMVVLSFMGWLIWSAIRWVSANELKDGESE